MPSWWDRFGEEWASQGLTEDPTIAQADAGWAYIGQAPPTVEQFNSMFQWSDDKDNWLYGQIINVIASANLTPDPADLTQLLQAITAKQKRLLLAPLNIYCDAINGNDSTADGTQAKPFKTIQQAYNWCGINIEPAGQWIICNLRPGTYAPFQASGTKIPYFQIYGDPLNPRSYLIKNTNGVAVVAVYCAVIAVQGISVEATGPDGTYTANGSGLAGYNAGVIIYQDIAFGPCSNSQMLTSTAGQVYSNGSISYSIYGGAKWHMWSSASGITTAVQSHVTITNNPTFSQSFIISTVGGCVQAWESTYTGTTQGSRGAVDANGTCNIAGANPNTFFPGTSNVTINRGGLFI